MKCKKKQKKVTKWLIPYSYNNGLLVDRFQVQ